MSARNDYEIIVKKHKALPPWEWLEENFKIKEDEGKILEIIRVSMSDKIEGICRGILEPLLGGAENYCCWYERRMVSKDDKKKIFDIYRKLEALLWTSNKISLSPAEKNYINWIIDVKKTWDKHADDIAKTCDKVAKGWETYKKPDSNTQYHG